MIKDYDIIRDLAKQCAEAAASPAAQERTQRYRDHNSLKIVRPIVLVFEEPWDEFEHLDEMKCLCEDEFARNVELNLRRELFKWNNYQADYIIPPYYGVPVKITSTDTGLYIREEVAVLNKTTGESVKSLNEIHMPPHCSPPNTEVISHHYEDWLNSYEALATIKEPTLTYHEKETLEEMARTQELLGDTLPVKKLGTGVYFNPWDRIPRLHKDQEMLMDLYTQPDFMHAVIKRMTELNTRVLDEFERLDVLESELYYMHGTPALSSELPARDFAGKVRCKDVWYRGMAQIFAVVSPEMHNEFDVEYMKPLAERCGLTYYGCCEPLDTKIDILRKIKNLRKISITPWADARHAAEQMRGDYIMSLKVNPSKFITDTFDEEAARFEIENAVKACRQYGTPLEIISKDLSTVKGRYDWLARWVKIAQEVIDQYY